MAVRKKFINIEAPLLEETIQVLGTPESLAGKTIKVDLSRRLRGKSLEVILKIYNKNGLFALPKNINLMKFYIRRMMRKRASYVEDSFLAKCRDIEVTIKPFLITRKRVSRAVRANLRRTSREFLTNYLKEKDYLDVCKELVSGQMQKEMLPKLKKVYPLSFCEIRVFETRQIDSVQYAHAPIEKKQASEELSERPVEAEVEEKSQIEEIEAEIESTKEEKKAEQKAEKKKSSKKVKEE
jgi:ribosomal protein S3AE